MPVSGPSLRFAILVRDGRLERWQLRALRELLEVPDVQLVALLSQGSPVARPIRRMERRANRSLLYRAVWGKPRASGQRYRERLPLQFADLPAFQVDSGSLPVAELDALQLDFIL